MRFAQRATMLIAVAITGPALAAPTIAAAAPAPSAPAMAPAARGCKVTATIGVGTFPLAVAANPKTNTIYVTNDTSQTVSVISGRTNTVTATTPVLPGFLDGVAEPDSD